MPDTHGALRRLVTQLRNAGYSADVDPAGVEPPGVWVQPRSLSGYRLDGSAEATVWLYAVASTSVDYWQAISQLDDALDGLLSLFGPADDDPDVDLMASVILPQINTPLPAYRLAIDLEVEPPA